MWVFDKKERLFTQQAILSINRFFSIVMKSEILTLVRGVKSQILLTGFSP